MAIGVTRAPVGPGRVLAAAYALFVVAAGSRAAVQLATGADRAPLAYTLSAVAAALYAVNLVLIVRADRGGPARAALVFAVVELVGVLTVGAGSMADRGAFPDATVWSDFGAGYLFVPLALPVLVIAWRRSRTN